MTFELFILSYAAEHSRVCQKSSCCLLHAIALTIYRTSQDSGKNHQETVSTEEAEDRNNLAYRVKEFIQAHCCEPCSLNGIAKAIGCHPRQAERCFKIRYGTSIRAYVQAARTAEALNLLSHTDLKIEAVAISVGFKSRSSLYRAFDKLGVPEGGIRKALTENRVRYRASP